MAVTQRGGSMLIKQLRPARESDADRSRMPITRLQFSLRQTATMMHRNGKMPLIVVKASFLPVSRCSIMGIFAKQREKQSSRNTSWL